MASIVGAIATSHIPAIGRAIERKLENVPYWKPFFDGYGPVREWVQEVRPDVAVVVYNDHGLNFFLDKMPTFAVGAAPEYRNADEGWGLSVARPYPGYPELSWHLIESLVDEEFDLTTCQEMLVDHGFTVPMSLLWPDKDSRPVCTIPICINTVQFPYPSPLRCLKLGRAVARAIESFEKDLNVLIVGTGGLSHQLEGKRAGFINPDFDRLCMDKIVNEPEVLACYSTEDLIRFCGSQGVEFLNWLVMRGAVPGAVIEKHRNYHVPISNTAGATMILEKCGEALLASGRG
jgi:protocatechuate 4,5-dioxygenase, beta chain